MNPKYSYLHLISLSEPNADLVSELMAQIARDARLDMRGKWELFDAVTRWGVSGAR